MCVCVCVCVCVCMCVCVRVFSLHPFLCMYALVLRFVSRSQGKSNCHFKIFCFVFLFLYYIIVNDLCGKKKKKMKVPMFFNNSSRLLILLLVIYIMCYASPTFSTRNPSRIRYTVLEGMASFFKKMKYYLKNV